MNGLNPSVLFHSSGSENSPLVLGLCGNPNWLLPAEDERVGGPAYHEMLSLRRDLDPQFEVWFSME